ncbi:hypothetical protein [uncultured Selenomonas sp.]|uniref:hypothetical protein n=1 Tax=uncultured Selenomonas sp. TaxID=159275 RepID=UPI0025CD0F26|nr:hypothetical protein [uncultured Selenomonas sp.]
MDHDKIPLARLYRRLFSRFWPERLKAYDMIADDLERRGCRLFRIREIMPHEIDAKLLTGQIVSIYMKQRQPMKLSEFVVELEKLYAFLLQPLRDELSKGHRLVKQLLALIYDEDDWTARRQIEAFFQQEPRPELSVLGNMFRCYSATMWEVRKRSEALGLYHAEESNAPLAQAVGHGVA